MSPETKYHLPSVLLEKVSFCNFIALFQSKVVEQFLNLNYNNSHMSCLNLILHMSNHNKINFLIFQHNGVNKFLFTLTEEKFI